MMNNFKTLLKGIITENPVLVLLLGTCPTLAKTSDVKSAVGMAAAVAAVLILSNIVISLLRNIIPDKVRIPCYIVIIAGFVTATEMITEAFFPDIYKALGIFLSLIVVNCVILGRAEMFASKNGVVASICDGVGMAIGFAIALVAMASIREILGAGTFYGYELAFMKDYTVKFFTSPAGGFFVFGVLIAIVNKAMSFKRKPKAEFGCEGCPSAAACKNDCQKEAE